MRSLHLPVVADEVLEAVVCGSVELAVADLAEGLADVHVVLYVASYDRLESLKVGLVGRVELGRFLAEDGHAVRIGPVSPRSTARGRWQRRCGSGNLSQRPA